MTEMLPFLLGCLVGGACGVGLMCIMAVARSSDDNEMLCTRECLARRGITLEVKR